MTDDTSTPFDWSKWPKDECYPLLSVIQSLVLWAQHEGKIAPDGFTGSNSIPSGEGLRQYSTTFSITFPRIIDFNEMAQMDQASILAVMDSIVKYVEAMKPAAS